MEGRGGLIESIKLTQTNIFSIHLTQKVCKRKAPKILPKLGSI